jgi:uncharacterized protein (DUF488 family)
MITLMTIGYQDRTVDQLIDDLATADAKVLVDVRWPRLGRR